MIVVLLSMPDFPSSASSAGFGTMSRMTVSHRSVVQFHPAAPGTWPWSYAVVSTSTSTTRFPASVACWATHSVFTRTSASVFVLMQASFFLSLRAAHSNSPWTPAVLVRLQHGVPRGHDRRRHARARAAANDRSDERLHFDLVRLLAVALQRR